MSPEAPAARPTTRRHDLVSPAGLSRLQPVRTFRPFDLRPDLGAGTNGTGSGGHRPDNRTARLRLPQFAASDPARRPNRVRRGLAQADSEVKVVFIVVDLAQVQQIKTSVNARAQGRRRLDATSLNLTRPPTVRACRTRTSTAAAANWE